VQFVEVLEDEPGVVERVGSLRMARELGDLPGREVRKDVLRELFALLLQAGDLFLDVDRRSGRNVLELFDLGLELGDRLFEIEEIHCHKGAEDSRTGTDARRRHRGRHQPLMEETSALAGGGL
jgi:hypothetical protein